VIPTTFITIEDTWTINQFRSLYPEADRILTANGLPSSKAPFGTIGEQLRTVSNGLDDPDVLSGWSVTQEEQIKSVADNITDLLFAKEIASMSIEEFSDFVKYDKHPNFLTVPAEVCDRSRVYDRGYYYQDVLNCGDIDEVRTLLENISPDDAYTSGTPSDRKTPDMGTSSWFWENPGEVLFVVHYADGDMSLPIPAWPEDVRDNNAVSWSQEMTTFQHYEPWNTYKGSGPRTVTCTFKLHRAMWDGNQDSGDCERLVALMESTCYPDYSIQSAEPPRCTLRVGESVQIHGITTAFDKTYSGPIGPDTKYDCVTINITITEESQNVLSTQAVGKSLMSGWR